MNVSFRHGYDSQPVLSGEFQVAINVALGVDDDGLAAALAADEICVLCECGVGDLAEKHGFWEGDSI
jgi:hypothetical protein